MAHYDHLPGLRSGYDTSTSSTAFGMNALSTSLPREASVINRQLPPPSYGHANTQLTASQNRTQYDADLWVASGQGQQQSPSGLSPPVTRRASATDVSAQSPKYSLQGYQFPSTPEDSPTTSVPSNDGQYYNVLTDDFHQSSGREYPLLVSDPACQVISNHEHRDTHRQHQRRSIPTEQKFRNDLAKGFLQSATRAASPREYKNSTKQQQRSTSFATDDRNQHLSAMFGDYTNRQPQPKESASRFESRRSGSKAFPSDDTYHCQKQRDPLKSKRSLSGKDLSTKKDHKY
ncbi:hypothetical protein FH972_025155 [Carpinus fangiana]|uniref:Uncharacterized protein n=1 Tax=Carpinus fangiana TaxID=176857 RepID=A0A5N6L074_9ROSI|nr:hypothetical protein FH972_025155 [Carpinus fangiana]